MTDSQRKCKANAFTSVFLVNREKSETRQTSTDNNCNDGCGQTVLMKEHCGRESWYYNCSTEVNDFRKHCNDSLVFSYRFHGTMDNTNNSLQSDYLMNCFFHLISLWVRQLLILIGTIESLERPHGLAWTIYRNTCLESTYPYSDAFQWFSSDQILIPWRCLTRSILFYFITVFLLRVFCFFELWFPVSVPKKKKIKIAPNANVKQFLAVKKQLKVNSN